MAPMILIVDDEPDLVRTLDYNLKRAGYSTSKALTGNIALDLLAKDPLPDLVLLDLMLPDLSGTEVCRRLRANERTRKVPVVMLTAKGEESDRVIGFEVGADDFVVKPFSVRELLLRIQAVLRRTQLEGENERETIGFGTLEVDISGHHVRVDEEEITLTSLEFRLLTTLLNRKGRVQTRERLLDDVWGYGADVTTRTVDTHVKRLREKLGPSGRFIETVRGVGYRFRDQPDV